MLNKTFQLWAKAVDSTTYFLTAGSALQIGSISTNLPQRG